jgi:hypothetical protein
MSDGITVRRAEDAATLKGFATERFATKTTRRTTQGWACHNFGTISARLRHSQSPVKIREQYKFLI